MEEFQKLETLTEAQEIAKEAKEYYGAGQCGTQAINTDLRVAAALMRAQASFAPILKDTDNPFFKSKYATLDGVIASVRPALRNEGLVILQKNVRRGTEVGVQTRLVHIDSGEEYTSELFAPPDKLNSQGIGSVLTYLRRYELLTITGAASEDDDGNASSGRSQSEQRGQHQDPPKHFVTGTQVRMAAQNKPSNAPPIAFPAVSSHSVDSTAVPSILKTLTLPSTPTESTGLVDPNVVPTKDQYDAYIAKAIALTEQLEKAGLKSGRGLPAKTKLKRYIFHVTQVEKLEDLKIGQWDLLFTEFEKLLAADSKRAVELVEAANAKETANG